MVKQKYKKTSKIKETGIAALESTLKSDNKIITTVKLATFQKQKKKLLKSTAQNISDEVLALLRMTQIMDSGSNLDVTQLPYIGNHECSSYPLYLFIEDGRMRSAILERKTQC